MTAAGVQQHVRGLRAPVSRTCKFFREKKCSDCKRLTAKTKNNSSQVKQRGGQIWYLLLTLCSPGAGSPDEARMEMGGMGFSILRV